MTITNMMTDANTLPGHTRQNCPELKRRGQRKNDDPKSLRAWSGEDALKYDQNETINICFMEMGEPSEVRHHDCSKCNHLQYSLDMVTDGLQKVIDEYKKIAQEKKDWQILLKASQIEVDLLQEELDEIKMQLNSIKKSPSHNSERSNRSIMNASQNSSFHSAKSSFKPICFTSGITGHKSFNFKKLSS
ncbi:hypothetical protein KY289_001059 [Solanum tuberosum]|nr:hypothetical protein KY289_001059 [Solanum tuberosum]